MSVDDPRLAWIYCHYSATGVLLYVGKTHQRRYRQRAHEKQSRWWPLVAEVDYFGPYDKRGVLDVEAALISTHNPPYNLMGSARQATVYERAAATRRRNRVSA